MIEAIRARIEAIEPPPFRQVGLAADYASLDAPPPVARLPAAYVIELADSADPNGLATGGVRQRLTRTIGVVLIVSALRDAKGGAAVASLAPLRQALRLALVGIEPDEAHEPVTYARGRLLAAAGGFVAWQDEFSTRTTIRIPA
jgi:hypothetical protein